MKKHFIIFLLSIYMLSTTELHQLLKLPFLIEHFIEHKEQNSKLTFYEFLYMHYSYEKEDGDYQKDMKLPFKAHDNCNFANIMAFIPLPLQAFSWLLKLPFDETKVFNPYNPSFFNSAYLSVIWQPPKFK